MKNIIYQSNLLQPQHPLLPTQRRKPTKPPSPLLLIHPIPPTTPTNPLNSIPLIPPLRRPPSHKNPLNPLPPLDTAQKQPRLDKHNPPLPPNPNMLKHHIINHRDIQHGERKHESDHNAPEEVLVAVDIGEPACVFISRLGRGV